MEPKGSSVTLMFLRVNRDQLHKEPFLNLLAAGGQMLMAGGASGSDLTHVEMAIGEDAGASGQMKNVCRIYNDSVGVELCERTGRNPAYSYLSLGCSKLAEERMLHFAKQQKGKPFSNIGMMRSLILPRRSDGTSWFCAELVAAVLKVGGLMSQDSNPGAATPASLYKLYAKRAATTANPYALRSSMHLSFNAVRGGAPHARPLLAQPSRRKGSPPRERFQLLRGDAF